MNNIEQYKNRFFNLMESTIGDVRPLISEQDDVPPRKEVETITLDTPTGKFLMEKGKIYKMTNDIDNKDHDVKLEKIVVRDDNTIDWFLAKIDGRIYELTLTTHEDEKKYGIHGNNETGAFFPPDTYKFIKEKNLKPKQY
jgi:hypothetical protein